MNKAQHDKGTDPGFSRRHFGMRMLALGLLAPLARFEPLVHSAAVPAAGLQLPDAGADFWQRPHAYVACLHDDGTLTLSDDPELTRSGTVGAGEVLPDGRVAWGLGFVEVACADCSYLLRVVDLRTNPAPAGAAASGGQPGGLRITRPALGGGALEISVAESTSGAGYLLESTESLSHPQWRPVAERRGTGGSLRFRLPMGNQPTGFFRLRPQPRVSL